MAAFWRMYFVLLLVGLCVVPALAKAEGKPPALHKAILRRDIEEVKSLVNQGADLAAKDKIGLTPLHLAAYTGPYEVVKFLIAKGADVAARDDDGSTPLHRACDRGRKDVADLLIEKGADVNLRTKLGLTPLSHAVDSGNIGLVKLLITKGADANTRDGEGIPVLHTAAGRCYKDMVELLIANGADVNASFNGTPLHLLTFSLAPQAKDMAKLLIAKGADVNHGGMQRGMTPLHAAIENRNKDIFEVVMTSDANVNARDESGRTPLHYLAMHQAKEIPKEMANEMAQHLIARGADVEAKDKSGNTPLHMALKGGGKDIVKLLIESGATYEYKELLLALIKSPKEFDKLSTKEKAEILSTIAESAYRILFSEVPSEGLRGSENSIMNIIGSRIWLRNTDDVVARLLAIRLQHAVDSCILNEMFRKERHKHRRPGKKAYKKGSLDHKLLQSLLKKNEIDELEYIDFALSLDTEIGQFCRANNYSARDFLTGRVFKKENRKGLTEHFERVWTEDGKEKRQTLSVQVDKLLSWTPPAMISSKKEAAKAVLPMTLRAIDDAINTRLLGRIFTKYDGFADKAEGEVPIVASRQFENRVRMELSKENARRRMTTRKEYKNGVDKIMSDVWYRLRKRTEQDLDSAVDGYRSWLVFDLAPFIANPFVLPDSFIRNELIMEDIGMGSWLNLPD